MLLEYTVVRECRGPATDELRIIIVCVAVFTDTGNNFYTGGVGTLAGNLHVLGQFGLANCFGAQIQHLQQNECKVAHTNYKIYTGTRYLIRKGWPLAKTSLLSPFSVAPLNE